MRGHVTRAINGAVRLIAVLLLGLAVSVQGADAGVGGGGLQCVFAPNHKCLGTAGQVSTMKCKKDAGQICQSCVIEPGSTCELFGTTVEAEGYTYASDGED
jgi:hypothetical protein